LDGLASSYGYQLKVMPFYGNLTKHEQRDLYHSASIVLGLHGGAFANMAFCNPNVTIIEINNGGPWRRDIFCCMALALQFNYFRFPLARMSYGSAEVRLNDQQIDSLFSIIKEEIQRKKVSNDHFNVIIKI